MNVSNGWMPSLAVMSPIITFLGLNFKHNWNNKFGGNAVVVPDTGELPKKTLHDGFEIILLSPYNLELQNLKKEWQRFLDEERKYMEKSKIKKKAAKEIELLTIDEIENLSSQTFPQDSSVANGSSIAFILKYKRKKVLFGADAYPEILLRSIKKIVPEDGKKLKLNAFKVPHHGSKYNITKELLKKLDCKTYLFSTNGVGHEHPHKEAVAKIVKDETVSKEMLLVEKVLEEISKDGLVVYGLNEVKKAIEYGAVDTLLITDKLITKFKQEDFSKLDKLLLSVEKIKGKIQTISSEHEGGKKLDNLGGIAALLRFKV